MECTGIPQATVDQGSQEDEEILVVWENADIDLDDLNQQFVTNTEEPTSVVTIEFPPQQPNDHAYADFEKSSHEMSTREDKTTCNQARENVVSEGYVCDLCGQSFAYKDLLKKHKRRVHHRRKPHICRYCLKAFYHKSDLREHIATVHKESKSKMSISAVHKEGKRKMGTSAEHKEDKSKMSTLAGYTLEQNSADYLENFCSRTDDLRCSVCQKDFKQTGNLVKHIKYVHRNGEGVQLNCTWPGCIKTFKYTNSLNRHLSRHKNRAKNFHCNLCGTSMKSSAGFSKHMEVHNNKAGGVTYPCQTCGKVYYLKNHLKQHEKSHETSNFVCDICGKKYPLQCSLNQHVRRVHLKEKTHFCTKCAEGFFDNGALNRHIAIVHEDQDMYITCHVCGKSVRRDNIKHHVRLVHPTFDRVKCPLCEKDFKTPSSLNGHIKDVHKNKGRVFACTWPNCDKSFFTNRDLKQHLNGHNDVRPHTCQICSKKFRNIGHLKSHMDMHNGVKAYRCQLCLKDFVTKGNVNRHMAAVHGKGSYIPEVNKNRDRGKVFACTWPNCKKSFFRSSDLKTHLNGHNDVRPHTCQICSKKFRQISHLKPHMDMHMGVKAYRCQLCSKDFVTKGNLTRHVAAVHGKQSNIPEDSAT